MSVTNNKKQERLPKLDYIERLVDSMVKRGAIRVTLGEFSVELHPGFKPNEPEMLDAGPASEAKHAIKDAMEKVKRANRQEEEDLFWSV